MSNDKIFSQILVEIEEMNLSAEDAERIRTILRKYQNGAEETRTKPA
ncbi:hypothetical protein OS242_10315 [Tumebacillus sp. DT12]|uniref:Uncharacterized protein n=1 Tax=Tumebacillus lacus TaxID=2995335 RepID=A0ABT3X317_9BACL|nr:hypothetical protein [Tumebacillus lacus]MCX7570357.1 hypothetical protein [Tumebacillus lacus]